ncbi:MAG: TIGR00730 family Rossman fold protein [Candidatus Paceibacterota bacterium]
MREDVARTLEEVDRGAEAPKGEKYIPNKVSFWRLIAILREFQKGFNLIQKYSLAVTFFGSSRECLSKETYAEVTKLARILSKDGFTVITGGGGGVMGAANKGAHEAGGDSVGVNIKLPHEQNLNKYTTDSKEFKYFFIRKIMLSFASEAYIFFPGGYGTLDEFFEIITLIQTKKIQPIPVVLVGKSYWSPLIEWINKTLYEKKGTINKEDLEIFFLVDNAEEAHKATHLLLKKLCPTCLADHGVAEKCE